MKKSFFISFVVGIFLVFAYQNFKLKNLDKSLQNRNAQLQQQVRLSLDTVVIPEAIPENTPPVAQASTDGSFDNGSSGTSTSVTTTNSSATSAAQDAVQNSQKLVQSETEAKKQAEDARLAELLTLRIQLENSLNPATGNPGVSSEAIQAQIK